MAVMGRPKSENPKNKNLSVRMTEEEYREILAYSSGRGQTITKTLLEGFELLKQKKKPT